MRVFMGEYALAVVSVIIGTMVIYIFTQIYSDVSFVFHQHYLYRVADTGEYMQEQVGNFGDGHAFSSIFGTSGVADGRDVPYFVLNGELNTTLTGGSSIRNELLQGKLHVKNNAGTTFPDNNIIITLIEYRPTVIADTSLTGKVEYVMENYDALDQFGNPIFMDETRSEAMQSKRVKYTKTLYVDTVNGDSVEAVTQRYYDTGLLSLSGADDAEFTGVAALNSFTVDQDTPCKYKVIYRYTYGTYKCEYIEFFRNDVKTMYEQAFDDLT